MLISLLRVSTDVRIDGISFNDLNFGVQKCYAEGGVVDPSSSDTGWSLSRSALSLASLRSSSSVFMIESNSSPTQLPASSDSTTFVVSIALLLNVWLENPCHLLGKFGEI